MKNLLSKLFRRGSAAPDAPRGLRTRLKLAWLAVAWERLWPAIWPASAVLAVFLSLALLGVLPALGPWLHAAVILIFAAVFAASLRHGLRGFSRPTRKDAQRRLERDSELPHRPLSGLEDSPAGGARDPASRALWQAHQSRLRSLIGQLRVRLPSGSLAARDPRGLRAIPVLLLVIGLAAGASDAPYRLTNAVLPDFAATAGPPPQVAIWIDPPSYTGAAPDFLDVESPGGEILRVPEGSRLMVQVQGVGATPALTLGEEGGGAVESPEFERVTGDAWKAETTLSTAAAGRMTLSRGGGAALGSWDLQIVPDMTPRVRFTQQPERAEGGRLEVAYAAEDDYGLSALSLKIDRPQDARNDPVRQALPISGGAPNAVEANSRQDFTDHVWAGLEVEMTLIAEDARGQTGESRTVAMVLPERRFQHPVAQRLVELRQMLTLDPEKREPVTRGLHRLAAKPEAFGHRLATAMAINAAELRLIHDQRDRAIGEVQDLMWETAVRLEDGAAALAERDLRDAQDALREALADDEASPEEIQQLMDELEAALEQYMQALAEDMRDRMAEGETPPFMPPDAETMDSQDFREMMQQMRDMAETGARDAARDMLSRLESMLDNLQTGRPSGEMGEMVEQAMEMMRELRELGDRQQELLDESFQQQQQRREALSGQSGDRPQQDGETGGDGEAGMGEQAQRQEDLRRRLGQLMRDLANELGDIPAQLGEAEQDMREATRQLGEGQPGDAVEPQSDALNNLRDGSQAMQEAFQQRFAEQMGQGMSVMPGQGQQGRDPLGRRQRRDGEGALDTGEVDVPDETELRRAHEILNELRRRSSERERPEIELDYLNRLLQRF